MSNPSKRGHSIAVHPLYAIVLGSSWPLFVGALLSDIAYASTFQVQWLNFASWLSAGALFTAAVALVWELTRVIRTVSPRTSRQMLFVSTSAVAWALGFINALVHAKDAWATMPEGLYLSALVAILALGAAWAGYSGIQYEEVT